MLRTTAKNNLKQSLKAILAVAALGLTAGAANAQYGAYNTSNSFGLTRLGGPVVVADYSGYGSGYGYGGGYSGFNNGFYGSAGANGNYATPQNTAFNGNGSVGVGSNGFTGGSQLITDPTTGQLISSTNAAANASANFNAQLAQFNANRTALVNAMASGNASIIQQNGVTGNLAGNSFINGQAVAPSVFNGGVVRMPSDGSIVVQSTGTASGQVAAPSVFNGGDVVRMPSDGSIVVQSNGFSNFANGMTYGTNFNANYSGNVRTSTFPGYPSIGGRTYRPLLGVGGGRAR